MAEKKINIDIILNTANAAKSVGEIRKSLKEIESTKLNLDEGGKSFDLLSNKAAELKDKIDDLNDATNSLKGSGVEKLNTGFGLLADSFNNADFGKAKLGFKVLGQALDAIPIFLVLEGLKYLYENFDKVAEILTKVFPALSSTSDETRRLESENKKLIESNKLLIVQLDNEIKILEAQGASEAVLLQKKKEKIALQIKELESDNALQKSKINDIILNDDLLEGALKLEASILRKTGQDKQAEIIEQSIFAIKLQRGEEYVKKIKENEIAIANLKTDAIVEEIKVNNNAVKSNKEKLDKKLADEKQYWEDWFKIQKEEGEKVAAQLALERKQQEQAEDQAQKDAIAASQKANQDRIDAKLGALQKQLDIEKYFASGGYNTKREQIEAEKALLKAQFDEGLISATDYNNKVRALDKQTADAKKALFDASFGAAKGLEEAIFSIKLGNAKKGSAQELEIKKKQFQVEKAFSIGKATMDGYRAIQTVLASYPAPFNIPIAIATGIATAANIAKIASAKFEGGATGGGDAPNISAGSGGAQSAPPVNDFKQPVLEKIGGEAGTASTQKQLEPQKVYVVAEDISKSLDKNKLLEERNSF